MARRAPGALAAMLVLAAIALPAALIAAAPASAATAQASQPPATVTITGISPQWAGPGSTVTVTGIVANTSPAEERFIVQLLDASTPVSSVAELQQSAARLYGLADLILPTATWKSGLLKPGASASWSIRLPTSAMAMTGFGVYPIAAQVEDAFGDPLNSTESFLPYVPTKKGPYGSTLPAAQKIAWVWPVVDQPLLDEPWQDLCTDAQAATLAQSLTSSGRLGQLLDAAATPVGTAMTAAVQAQAVQAHPGEPTRSFLPEDQQPLSLASNDAVTWAIDPALLANVDALAQCGAKQPRWARAASAWLSKLKAATAGQQAFATPYGDPDVGTLIGAGLASDVQRSFTYGRSQASKILDRSLTPVSPGATATSQQQAAGLAWSADAQVSYGTLESLAAVDDIGTVLLNSSTFPAQQSSVLRTLDGNGSYLTVLLANDSLTSLLGAATNAPGSGFAVAQEFLAETALMAQQDPAVPIIVAPPQRWQPPTGLAADLLSATASAPWLTPSSLTSLTAGKQVPTVTAASSAGGAALSQSELGRLSALDRAVTQLQLLRAQPDPSLYLAVSTVESSAYGGRFRAAALSMITSLTDRIESKQQDVHIVSENRVTLGGLRGSVPVSIDNQLGYAVQVSLQLSYDAAGGAKVTASPPGLVTVPARTAKAIKVQVTASQTGSTTVTMTLANRRGQALAVRPVRMTLQTTQVGLLGMIIFAAALGVFLLASAARAIRRGGPRRAADQPSDPGPSEDEPSGHSTEEAAPDTVVPEHRELGTAGTPRPR
jgi:Family of unknown function (DUF6049)